MLIGSKKDWGASPSFFFVLKTFKPYQRGASKAGCWLKEIVCPTFHPLSNRIANPEPTKDERPADLSCPVTN
jgi:hypothetical protein